MSDPEQEVNLEEDDDDEEAPEPDVKVNGVVEHPTELVGEDGAESDIDLDEEHADKVGGKARDSEVSDGSVRSKSRQGSQPGHSEEELNWEGDDEYEQGHYGAAEWDGEGHQEGAKTTFRDRVSGAVSSNITGDFYRFSGETDGTEGIFGDSYWHVDDNADYAADISDYEDDDDDRTTRTRKSQMESGKSISDEWEEEEIEAVRETSEETLEKLMQIPDQPGRVKMDQLAADSTRRVDSAVKYYQPPEETTHGIPASDPKYESQAERRMDRCPSIESIFQMKKMVDVHFYLYPGGKMISRDCRLDATVFQLKNAIAHFVKVPPDHLDLRRKRNLVADQRSLMELGAGPRSKLKFTVEINKRIPGNFKLSLPKDKETIEPRSETRTVQVTNSKGVQSSVEVTIDYPTEPRPKLGGFHDTRTGLKYLHATTGARQIDAEQWSLSDRHKACQAFYEKHVSTQTKIDVGQQMDREDYYVSQANDRYLHAKKYVSWNEISRKKGKAIVTIQRYWRGWLARRERKLRLEGLIKRIEWAEKIKKGRIDQRYAIMDDEISRQECPKRMVDIELLYRAINLWRKEQEEYVMKNRWGAERKAALAILTEMEADLLLDLERTRKRIKESGRERVIESQFNKMGKPKRWLGKTNTFITMDTKERLNVRQLHHTYQDLNTPVLAEGEQPVEGSCSLEERLELLGRVNEMIKKVTNRLGVMLSDLITRELTYIRINCSKKLMASLRKRISNCFFLLCQDPVFNPEAKRLQKVPFDYTKLRKDMVQCKGCRRMWYRDEFSIQRGTTVTTRCHMCMGLYRTAILRVDLNLYRHMLDELRKDELAAGVVHSVTFLIDAFDLQFLVEQIWHGQSALSGIDNRYLLRLCRWVRGQPWTPWNCVLLTEEEAVSHIQLDNMNDAYRASFFHKVFVKQCTAKSYFEGLAKLSISLDEKTAEGCQRVVENEKRMKIVREKFKKKAKLLKILAFKQ